jgi:hypothetical protein
LPVAVSAWLVPAGRVGFAGASVIVTSFAAVTVTVVEPTIVPRVACAPVEPIATALTTPLLVLALLTVAIAALSVVQVTVLVMSTDDESEYVPVATNEVVVPTGRDGLAGVTAIETSAAAVTVTVAVPFTPPSAAVMVAFPPASPVTVPCEPAAFETDETFALLEVQMTVCVRSTVLLSEYVPVAVSLAVPLTAIVLVAGATVIDVRLAEVTVRVVEPEMLPTLAVMVVGPAAIAVAM